MGSDPHCGCALISQAEALEISSVQMMKATASGVQRQQVNSRGAGGTLYSSGSMCCSSSYVFLWIEEQIFYKVESSWVLFFGFLVWLGFCFFFVKQSRADSV